MIVFVSREAETDLEAVGDYIATNNPSRAAAFVRELREQCEGLTDMPRAFPLVPRYEHRGIRRRVYGNYLIFYAGRDRTNCRAPRAAWRHGLCGDSVP